MQDILAKVGPSSHHSFREARVLLRPLGNTIYVLPPYCVTRKDLQSVYNAIEAAVAALT